MLSSMKAFTALFARNIKYIFCTYNFFHFCSDGGGRSGVYLAVDANLELAEEEDCFDVFGFLKKLRQSRKGLIENEVRTNFV